MALNELFIRQGAVLAGDGIPLHFGDLKEEYHAALEAAVLLDRSHEGRIEIGGQDRFELLNRMSTNNLLNLQSGQGLQTVFITANARIIDRAMVYNWQDDSLLLITGPGRGDGLRNYLQRTIFFRDQVNLNDVGSITRQFALHGPKAEELIRALVLGSVPSSGYSGLKTVIAEAEVFIGRAKPLTGSHWIIVSPAEAADTVWQVVMQVGQTYGLRPAGGLTYNTLRIRAGEPGVGRELSEEYIPLEIGLWDEVSFNKGCYTGQEIIARMESRSRLARTIVRLELKEPIDAPQELFHEGRSAGMLTSSVVSPDGELFAMGVVKTALAQTGLTLNVSQPDGAEVHVSALIGAQPPYLAGG